ncbi:uncharacterized protein OCT59_011583 [Rhizophagus irregularis]|uniref:uncharacterized protein n=1 Tax=Rhizophagus irregularis TaxID=588596 RepID=UPI00331F27C1|nr:hypothetical protein OCT59_011583 [Rhizophagus irregularis]
MDNFILEKKLKWIPYKKFKDVEYLNEGGFGSVYKAIWLKENGDMEVVLKCPKDLNENLSKFLKEWKYHESCLDSTEIINLYGFTRNPDSKYMAIMDYANKGNLRENLTKIIKNNWKQRLYILYKIISGLHKIHEQNLIHCDFHDGNILKHNKYKNNLKDDENKDDEIYISDLGLCQPLESFLNKDSIYGVIPFMAPEILRDLMKKCWNEDPLERPSALKVKNIIKNWIFNPEISDISDINEELKSNIMEFINASIQCNNLITESHPQVCHTSRLLSFTSKELNKILENEDTHVYYLSHSTSGKVNEIQESGSLRDCIIINEDNEKDLI